MFIPRFRKSAPLAALLCLGLAASAPAGAASLSYFLDQSNALDDGVNYLRVTVADGADGAIDFTVEVLDPLADMAGGNFGIQSFAFNIIPGGAADSGSVSNLPDGWRGRDGRRMSEFGRFDIRLQGRGNHRLETLSFSITGIDGDTPSDYAVLSTGSRGPQLFAAHVAGFTLPGCDEGGCRRDDMDDYRVQSAGKGRDAWEHDWHHDWDEHWDHDWFEKECLTSAYFAGSTAVPLPGAAWLFGAGIAGALVRARRRRSA